MFRNQLDCLRLLADRLVVYENPNSVGRTRDANGRTTKITYYKIKDGVSTAYVEYLFTYDTSGNLSDLVINNIE